MTARTRLNFSRATKHEAYARSGGICECHRVPQLPTWRVGCGVALGIGNTFYEHIDPDALAGGNDISNAAVLCKTCWTLKTNSYDKPIIAKVKRLHDLGIGVRPRPFRPLPGTIASGIKLGFNSPPIDRKTGLPWGSK